MNAIETLGVAISKHRHNEHLLDGRDFDEKRHDANDAALAKLETLLQAAANAVAFRHGASMRALAAAVRDAKGDTT